MRFRAVIGFGMLLLAAAACERTPLVGSGMGGEGIDAPVDLAFSLENNVSVPKTKADSRITELVSTQENPEFRGLSEVRVLPFYTGVNTLVQPGTQSNGYARSLPDIQGSWDASAYDGSSFHEGLLSASRSHIYSGPDITLPAGTNAVLVYGRAAPLSAGSTLEWKHLNGSLAEDGWNWQPSYHLASDIQFSPDLIYGEVYGTTTAGAVAAEMASLLTELTDVSFTQHYYYEQNAQYKEGVVVLKWDDNLEDATLRSAFLEFVGNKGAFSGSGANLEYQLSKLYRLLTLYHPSNTITYQHVSGNNSYDALVSVPGDRLTWGQLYEGLRAALVAKIANWEALQVSETGVTFANSVYRQYPRLFGLPEGAAVLRWDGARLEAVSEDVGNFMAARRFCFMPPLYYYVNTPLSTAYNRNVYENFDGKSWEQVLGYYNAGKIVTRNINSVALDLPMQYACGMLVATVQAMTTSLPDNDGDDATNLEVSNASTAFPVKGILIGGQYPQRFDFTPVTDDESSPVFLSDCYTYDKHVSDIFLTTLVSNPIRTLALPTPRDREVYFFLEFINNSNRSFHGADGVIPQGSRFYLAGKMPAPSSVELAAGLDRVVMKDHYTSITCRVASLENAYLTIPQMGNPELVLGIQTQVNWYFSPSSYLVLE